MQIDHSVLIEAAELADRFYRKGRRFYRIEIHPLGLKIRGLDKTNLKFLTQFEQIISFVKLASPVGKEVIRETFNSMDDAIDRELLDKGVDPNGPVAEPAKLSKRMPVKLPMPEMLPGVVRSKPVRTRA